jgi:uncharacterized protein (DUF488 family)
VTRLLTIGHGTATAEELVALLDGAGAERLVDVRTAPGSRRHPQFRRETMAGWLAEAGVAYRWEPDLGGFRRPEPASVNQVLRHPAFRGLRRLHAHGRRSGRPWTGLLAEAADGPDDGHVLETLWWRCHRRLLADAAVLVRGAEVLHLDHRGGQEPHRPDRGRPPRRRPARLRPGRHPPCPVLTGGRGPAGGACREQEP